jgi:hypothetical protein
VQTFLQILRHAVDQRSYIPFRSARSDSDRESAYSIPDQNRDAYVRRSGLQPDAALVANLLCLASRLYSLSTETGAPSSRMCSSFAPMSGRR